MAFSVGGAQGQLYLTLPLFGDINLILGNSEINPRYFFGKSFLKFRAYPFPIHFFLLVHYRYEFKTNLTIEILQAYCLRRDVELSREVYESPSNYKEFSVQYKCCTFNGFCLLFSQ